MLCGKIKPPIDVRYGGDFSVNGLAEPMVKFFLGFNGGGP